MVSTYFNAEQIFDSAIDDLNRLKEKFILKLNKIEFTLNKTLLHPITSSSPKIMHKGYNILSEINLIKSSIDTTVDIDYYLIYKLIKYYSQIPDREPLQSLSIMQQLKNHHIYCLSHDTIKKIPAIAAYMSSMLSNLFSQLSERNYCDMNIVRPMIFMQSKETVYLFNTNWLNVIQNDLEKMLQYPVLLDSLPHPKHKRQPQRQQQLQASNNSLDIENNLNCFNFNNYWFDPQIMTSHNKEMQRLSSTKSNVINKALKEEYNQREIKLYKVLILVKEFAVNNPHLIKFKPIRQPVDATDKDLKEKIMRILSPYIAKEHKRDVTLYKMRRKEYKEEIYHMIEAFSRRDLNEYVFKCPIREITNSKALKSTNKFECIIANITVQGDQQHDNFKIKIPDPTSQLIQFKPQGDQQENNDSNWIPAPSQIVHSTVRNPYISDEETRFLAKINEIHSNGSFGKIGLLNMGNTCYMNASLQCLSHTLELTDYFLFNSFDFNILSPNDILSTYTELIKEVWVRNNQNSFIPIDFKYSFGKIYAQFNKVTLHDAHDFLSNLLISLHEELLFKYPKIRLDSIINSSMSLNGDNNSNINIKDNELQKLLDSAFITHKQTNDTIINDLFSCQYHTSLQCQTCLTENNVFEWSNVLDLQLPSVKRSISLKFCYVKKSKPELGRFPIAIYKNTKLTSLIRLIHSRYPHVAIPNIKALPIPIKGDTLINVWDYYDNRNEFVFYEQFSEPLIYFFPSPDKTSEMDIFYSRINKSQTVNDLINLIQQKIITKDQAKGKDKDKNIRNITIRLGLYLYHIDKIQASKCCTLCNEEYHNQPYCILNNEISIDALSSLIKSDILLRVILMFNNDSHVTDSEFTNENITSTSTFISLKDCLDYNTSLDELENWDCHQCKQNRNVVKLMKIAYMPKILIIRLMKQSQSQSPNETTTIKDDISINFPINDLDISKICLSSNMKSKYDLYGVVYDHNGHYTAKCFNAHSNKWLNYDDANVSDINDINDIVSIDAYLLFYKRKDE